MNSSYKSIMKTTGVVGVVQVVRLLFGLVRNKIIALFFGPTGLGVWGLYLSFTEMIQGAASLGLEKSSVKQIAENHNNIRQRTLIIQIVKYSLAVFSLFCTIIAAIFSPEFSNNIFGTPDYKEGVLICCVAVFINSLVSAYRSILNGLSEIRKLAYSQLIGMAIGNIIIFIFIPFFEQSAIPYYLLIIAICAFVPSFLFFRKLDMPAIKVSFFEVFQGFSLLMKIGLAFWLSAMFMTFINYMINIFLKEQLSFEVVGIYQASWTISNLYIGIILTSMGVSFFPKICRSISNKKESIILINEQIEFSLLVSFPFIVSIFVFSPILLMLLYSSEFEQGAEIIRWQILGVTVRLFGFPFGYALMAKGKAIQYTIAQFLFSGLNYTLIVLLVVNFGFDGLGINYFISYIVYTLVIGIFCYRILSYKISTFLLKIVRVYILIISLSAISVYYFDDLGGFVFGGGLVFFSTYYSYNELNKKLDINIFEYVKRKIKK